MPQSSAVLDRLLPSIIARAWSSQRSLLAQMRHRRFGQRVEGASATLAAEPRKSTGAAPGDDLAPRAMRTPLALGDDLAPRAMRTPLAFHPLMAARSQSVRATTLCAFGAFARPAVRRRLRRRFRRRAVPTAVQVRQRRKRFPALVRAQARDAAKPDREILRPHRIKPSPTPRQTDPNQQLTL